MTKKEKKRPKSLQFMSIHLVQARLLWTHGPTNHSSSLLCTCTVKHTPERNILHQSSQRPKSRAQPNGPATYQPTLPANPLRADCLAPPPVLWRFALLHSHPSNSVTQPAWARPWAHTGDWGPMPPSSLACTAVQYSIGLHCASRVASRRLACTRLLIRPFFPAFSCTLTQTRLTDRQARANLSTTQIAALVWSDSSLPNTFLFKLATCDDWTYSDNIMH